MNQRRARKWQKALAVVLAPMVFFFTVEVMCRLIYPRDYSNIGTVMPHAVLNHTWIPNSIADHSQWIDVGIPTYRHYHNAQGWVEEYDVTQKKPANTFRIFYVGDSFPEGTCGMDESLPSRVEAAL